MCSLRLCPCACSRFEAGVSGGLNELSLALLHVVYNPPPQKKTHLSALLVACGLWLTPRTQCQHPVSSGPQKLLFRCS